MPSSEDMIRDPKAQAEGQAAVTKLDPTHLSELVKAQKNEAEEATRELRILQRKYYDLWMNKVDFSDKEEWQTQLWVPKVFTAVEQATSLIQRALLDTPQPFGIEGNNDRSRVLAAKLWKPLLNMVMDKAGFPYKFSDAAKMGFITGVAGYLKVRPITVGVPKLMGTTTDPLTGVASPKFQIGKRSFISLEHILPWNIHVLY